MMNMRINFPNIVKITVWSTFLSQKLPIRIKHQVKIEFLNVMNISKKSDIKKQYTMIRIWEHMDISSNKHKLAFFFFTNINIFF